MLAAILFSMALATTDQTVNVAKGTKLDVNALRRKIGIVFQAYNLFPHMTVLQNVTLGPVQARKLSKSVARAQARELLVLIGLEDKASELRSLALSA